MELSDAAECLPDAESRYHAQRREQNERELNSH